MSSKGPSPQLVQQMICAIGAFHHELPIFNPKSQGKFNVTNVHVLMNFDNAKKLKEYLNGEYNLGNIAHFLYPICSIGMYSSLINVLGNSYSDERDERLYDIMSYAITSRNTTVIEYFKNEIDESFKNKNFHELAFTITELAAKYNVEL